MEITEQHVPKGVLPRQRLLHWVNAGMRHALQSAQSQSQSYPQAAIQCSCIPTPKCKNFLCCAEYPSWKFLAVLEISQAVEHDGKGASTLPVIHQS